MGLDFRGGNYKRYVRFGKRTIKQGEAAAVWNMSGVQTEIVGPKLVRLFYSNIRFLDRYSAKSEQYLVVSYIDGRTEHIAGPVTMFLNPVYHGTVSCKNFICLLSPNECCVVYTKVHNAKSEDGEIEVKKSEGGLMMKSLTSNSHDPNTQSTTLLRRIIKGPHTFMPSIYDTLHTFTWSHPTNPTFSILPTHHEFNNIGVVVKTKNNEEATIKLNVEVEIESVEGMIDNISDLPGVINKLLKSDLVAVASSIEYDQINSTLQNLCSTFGFNSLKTSLPLYGIKISLIQYLGFQASEQLLAHFKSSENNLRLIKKKEEDKREKMETYRQEEEIERLKLKSARERVEKEQELEEMKSNFNERMLKKAEQVKRERESEKIKTAVEGLRVLKELGVDLDGFLRERKGEGLGEVLEKMGGGVVKKIEFGLGGS